MPRDQRAGLVLKNPAHPVGLVFRDKGGSPVQLQSAPPRRLWQVAMVIGST